jgi:hypothetical protein
MLFFPHFRPLSENRLTSMAKFDSITTKIVKALRGKTRCLRRFRELLDAEKQCAGNCELTLEQSAESPTMPIQIGWLRASRWERVSRRYQEKAFVSLLT